MYVITDDQGRVRVSYTGHAPQGAVEVVPPEGWDAEHQQDWRLVDGNWQYNPLPEPEPAADPVTELQAENVLLRAQIQALSDRGEFVEDCIAEMATQVYSGV